MDMRAAIKITADVKGQQEIDRLRGSMGALDGTVSKVKMALGALGVAFSVQQFATWIKGAIDAADALNDLSQRTGIAVEDLDALSLVAEQNGTTIEAVSGSLSRMARLMGEASGGSKAAASNLRQFGIGVEEIRNGSISATEALARIADRIQQMPDGLQKSATAQKLFGKSAAELIPLLNAGGDAIRSSREELEKYGALMSSDFARSSDEFNDQIAVLNRLSRAAAVEIGGELLPAVNELLEKFLMFVESSGGIGQAFDDIATYFEPLTEIVRNTAAEWEKLKGLFEWLNNATAKYGPFSSSKPLEINIDGTGVAVGGSIDPVGVYGPIKARPGTTGSGGFNFDFGAEDAAAKAEKAVQKRISDLTRQNQIIDDYVLKESEAIDLLRLESQQVGISSFAYEQLVEAKQHEYDVARATNDMLPETASKYRDVADALFATKQELERFNYEQSRTFEFGAKQALQEYAENASNAADQIGGVIDDAFGGMEDALVEFVKTGKLDFSSLIDSMIADLARLAVRQAILAPLAAALGGAFASGGVMTSGGPVPLRTYASGGIARSPQLALFGEGSMAEAYVPLPDGRNIPVRMEGGGGGNVQVIVNNNSGQNVTTNETTDGRGNRRIEVQVGEMIASEIRRSGSSANMAIRSSFRASPALTGR